MKKSQNYHKIINRKKVLVCLGVLCVLYDNEDVVSVRSHHDLVLLENILSYNRVPAWLGGISVLNYEPLF